MDKSGSAERISETQNDSWERLRVGEMSPNTVAEIARMSGEEVKSQSAELSSERTENMVVPEVLPVEPMPEMLAPSTAAAITFNDRGQERLSNEAVAEVEAAIKEKGDDPAALNTVVDDLGQTLILNAYNRRRGDGLAI